MHHFKHEYFAGQHTAEYLKLRTDLISSDLKKIWILKKHFMSILGRFGLVSDYSFEI